MTDTDEAAFMRTIREHPDLDAPRLVFADWLDEHARRDPCEQCDGTGVVHVGRGRERMCPVCVSGVVSDGRAERAEFIRVECELATLEAAQGTPDFWSALRKRHIDCDGCSDWCRLRKRERELLIECGSRWYEELGRSITGGTECATWSVEGVQPHGWMVFGGGWAVQREPFHKGFVGHVTGTLEWLIGGGCGRCDGTGDVYVDLVGASGLHDDGRRACPDCHGTGRTLGHLQELVRRLPITRVTVTDREPADRSSVNGCWYWFLREQLPIPPVSDDAPFLPPEVFSLLPSVVGRDRILAAPYPNREAALAALSDALLAWARKEQP